MWCDLRGAIFQVLSNPLNCSLPLKIRSIAFMNNAITRISITKHFSGFFRIPVIHCYQIGMGYKRATTCTPSSLKKIFKLFHAYYNIHIKENCNAD